MPPPDGEPCWRDPDHFAHSLGLGVELAMAKHTPSKLSHLQGWNIEPDQTVFLVAEVTPVKTEVAGEEGWMPQTVQKRNDLFVLHALSSQVVANVANGDTPLAQEHTLTRKDILIQDVHEGTGSTLYSSACSMKARPASRTASAMAS